MLEAIFGPILGWEITTTARRRRYYIFRILFALLCLFIMWTTFESVNARSYYNSGQSKAKLGPLFSEEFFTQFLMISLFTVLAITPAYLATCVIVERERKTLDYLLTTDLTSREIIFGKWLGRTFNVFSLLMTSLPILAATFFYGGITLDDIVVLIIVLSGTTASVSGLAILCSVYAKRTREALSGAYAILLLYMIAPATALLLVMPFCPENVSAINYFESTFDVSFERFFAWFNPFALVAQISMMRFNGGGLVNATLLLTYGGVQLGVCGLCVALSAWRLRGAHDRLTSGSSFLKSFRRLAWIRRGWIPPVPENGLFWKEWYFANSMGNVILQTLAVIGLIFLLYFPYHDPYINWTRQPRTEGLERMRPDDLRSFYRVVTPMLFVLAYLNAALKAGGIITGEKDRDCWVSLLSTSLENKTIIFWKWLCTMKPILWLWALSVPAWLIAIYFGGLNFTSVLIMTLATLTFGAFFCAVGLWFSLRRKTTSGAIGLTVFVGLFVCGLGQSIIYVFLIAAGPLFSRDPLYGNRMELTFVTMSNPIMSIVYSCRSNLWEGNSYGPSVESYMFWVPVMIIAYGIAAFLLVRRSIDAFQHFTERTETTLRR